MTPKKSKRSSFYWLRAAGRAPRDIPFSIRIDSRTLARVRAAAKREDRSASAWIRQAIIRALAVDQAKP